MADDLSKQQDSIAPAETLLPTSVAAPAPAPLPQRAPLHGTRFALAYALLAVALGAACGLAVVLFDSEAEPAVRWADWSPSSEGTTPRLNEIAEYVGTKYRLPSGNQLVSLTVKPLAVEGEGGAVPVTDIVTRSGTAEGDVFDGVTGERAFMFNMCGLAERCAIGEGEASAARGRLLRREALELALYTFKHVEAVDSVVVFMPPPPDPQSSQVAVYLKRSDFQPQLAVPLEETLLPLSRLSVGDVTPAEGDLVDALTESRAFGFEFRPTPTGGAALVFTPVG